MEITIDQALQRGSKLTKQVSFRRQYYNGIIRANPKHPDANHNFGVLAVGVGKIQEALPFFKVALDVSPTTSQYWRSYIEALIKLNKLDTGICYLEQKSRGLLTGFDELEKKLILPDPLK